MAKVLCLDWDKRSLRLVVARVGGGKTVLEDAHSHRLPNTVDADDPQAMGEYIRQMMRRHRLHHKRALVDVPREKAVIHRLTLPPTPTDEVAAAVRFQAMKELPFSVDSAAIDYVVMERNESGQATEVLLAAVTRETLDNIRATCEAAGLAPSRIGLRPYANLVSVQRVHEVTGRRLLFIDVGPGATEIDVIHDDTLAFARSANVNVPLPGGEGGAPEDSRTITLADISDLDASDEAIEAAAEELVVEVMRTLQAYRVTEPEGTIDMVLVAGGTGIESHLADALHRRLGYPVEMFDPTTALGVDPVDAPKLRSFSAALGLAWGLSREGLLELDFLNPKRPVSARETMQKRVRLGGMAAAIVVLAVIVGLTWQYRGLAAERERLQMINNKRWDELKEKYKVFNTIEEAQEWAVEAVWPAELLTVTALAIEPGKKMVVREIDMETVSRNPGITLRDLFVTDWQVPTEFVEKVTELDLAGEHPYDAAQSTWREIAEGQKFKGNTDVRIALTNLKKFREGAGDREKKRKGKLKRP